MFLFEGFTWWYRSWQDAISSSRLLQVKVFGIMLLITALAILSTSYFSHSWPFGSPGVQSSQEKMIKSALDSTSSQISNAVPSGSAGSNSLNGLQNCGGRLLWSRLKNCGLSINGLQPCDPDGDGDLELCPSIDASTTNKSP